MLKNAPHVIPIDDLPSMARAFEEFERNSPTESFVLDDVWVWPLIRTRIIGKMIYEVPYQNLDSEVRPVRATKSKSVRALAFQLQRTLVDFGRRVRMPRTHSAADVVAFSFPRRRKLHHGLFVDPNIDPILDGFERLGLSVASWNCGFDDGPQPAHRSAQQIGGILNDAMVAGGLRRRLRTALAEPEWFESIQEFVKERFDVVVKWNELSSMFRQIQDLRSVFERLLSATRPSLVLTSCWYNWPEAAAILAATSLRIPVCEVQHGMQEHVHPCYHRWSAASPGGFLNPFPKLLWVWGRKAAELYRGHSMAENVQVGGSMFLNQLILESSRKATAVNTRKMVVGYSVTWPLHPLIQDLKQTILACSTEWTWVFRTHPLDSKGPELLCQLKSELPAHRIDLESGQQGSVIEFLSKVDLHATHESTCALEALALGMPTLITLLRAAKSFSPWLRNGVLIEAFEPAEFQAAAVKALQVDSKLCMDAAEELFASPADTDVALKRLVQISGSRFNTDARGK